MQGIALFGQILTYRLILALFIATGLRANTPTSTNGSFRCSPKCAVSIIWVGTMKVLIISHWLATCTSGQKGFWRSYFTKVPKVWDLFRRPARLFFSTPSLCRHLQIRQIQTKVGLHCLLWMQIRVRQFSKVFISKGLYTSNLGFACE